MSLEGQEAVLAAAALQAASVAEGSLAAAAELAPPHPAPSPPPPPLGAAATRQRRRNLLPAAGWHVDAKYDSLYWTLASFVWWTYAAKLVPQLSWADNAQHFVMGASVVGMAALSTLRPSAYRRHGPVLRLLLLVYGYCMPVLTSLPVMNAFSPAPSKVPYLGALVDTYSLWLSTRNAFLSWALLGCRPPLHIALPLQLFGLWRITAAGFCAAPVLQHQLMVERTEVAHTLLTLSYSVCSAGPRVLDSVFPPTPYRRCTALLTFYNCIFGVLLPLLLLVPLRQVDQGGGGGGGRRARSWRRRADLCIEACLRPLMWPALLGTQAGWRQVVRGRQQGMAAAGEGQDAVQEPAPLAALLLRWYLVLMVLWTFCCLLT